MFKGPLKKIQRKDSICILCTLLGFKQFLTHCVIVFLVSGLQFSLDFLSFCIKLSINIIENTLLCWAQSTKPNSQRYVNMLPCWNLFQKIVMEKGQRTLVFRHYLQHGNDCRRRFSGPRRRGGGSRTQLSLNHVESCWGPKILWVMFHTSDPISRMFSVAATGSVLHFTSHGKAVFTDK